MDVKTLPVTGWDQVLSAKDQAFAIEALERGGVLALPQLSFKLLAGEARLLSPEFAGDSKNISWDTRTRALRGCRADEAGLASLSGLLERFAVSSRNLMRNLFPQYEAGLQQARTSFRPQEIAGRTISWRKDDTRLHVDSFPSSPTQGGRILRVFTNLNPHGQNRVWRLGEPFETVAQRYMPSLPRPFPGLSQAMQWLGVTKSRRSAYDHFMLQLHDRMKADPAYQAGAEQQFHEFAPGSSWIVYTDQASHAAMSGQYALEQTFHLPVSSMSDPSTSPIRVLEKLVGRALI